MSADGPVRILLCEDSVVARMIAVTACERLGCVVTSCEDAEAALKLIGPPEYDPPFDLVLTDIYLTGESGISLVKSIRAMGWSGFRLPIAAMTAHPTAQDEEDCQKAGGQFLLAKPLSETVLGEIIERAKPLEWRGESTRIMQDVELVHRFQASLLALRDAVMAPAQELENATPQRAQVIALLHEIAGVGSLFGNPGLAEQANVLENALRASLPDGWPAFESARADFLQRLSLSILPSHC
jgi:CheY-like chemotaxis protein